MQVSQAEVARRAAAEAEAGAVSPKPDPIATLNKLHAAGEGLDPASARAYLAEVRRERKQWRGSTA